MSKIEKLIEKRDELRNQISPHNPENTNLKVEIETINQQIRALVTKQDEENV